VQRQRQVEDGQKEVEKKEGGKRVQVTDTALARSLTSKLR
jgi:hypothetical protein